MQTRLLGDRHRGGRLLVRGGRADEEVLLERATDRVERVGQLRRRVGEEVRDDVDTALGDGRSQAALVADVRRHHVDLRGNGTVAAPSVDDGDLVARGARGTDACGADRAGAAEEEHA